MEDRPVLSIALGLTAIVLVPLLWHASYAAHEEVEAEAAGPGQVMTTGAQAGDCERESVRIAGGAWIGCQAGAVGRAKGKIGGPASPTRIQHTSGAVFIDMQGN